MKRLFSILLAMTFLLSGYAVAYADDSMMTSFNNRYGTDGTVLDTCNVCHTTAPARNSYGTAYLNHSLNFAAIEPLDSDGDGFTNIVEIEARTFPGNANSYPTEDTVAPTITAFRMPLTSTSLTVPITAFTATDNVEVTGYLVKTSPTTPLATSALWRATKPTSFTFATAGTKTLYAWVKDAAGNISARRSRTVTVDIVLPTITAFSMPLTSTSLTVPITTFTATDNVMVTGYLVKTSATKPLATSTLWRATKPTSFTFATAGTKTLYAWVKDAAGNISARRSRTVTITLPLAAASTSSSTTEATVKKLIPAPSGQQIFTYEPTDVPATNTDPAYAKPVGVGPIATGGDTLSIHVSIGKFANPVDISLTAYTPSGTGYQPVDISTLKPDNNFELFSGQMKTWKTGVTGVDEGVVDNIPISDLPSGLHMLILTVTSPDSPDSYYQWITYFTVQ